MAAVGGDYWRTVYDVLVAQQLHVVGHLRSNCCALQSASFPYHFATRLRAPSEVATKFGIVSFQNLSTWKGGRVRSFCNQEISNYRMNVTCSQYVQLLLLVHFWKLCSFKSLGGTTSPTQIKSRLALTN